MSRSKGTWNTRGTWAAGGALAAVLVLTGYIAFGGDGDDSTPAGKGGAQPSVSSSVSAAPTYEVPDDWTEPARWVALPRGKRTDKYGSQVGFPHTTTGGVALAAAAQASDVNEQKSVVDEHLRQYNSYLAAEDRSERVAERVELGAQQTDKTLHRQMGVAPGAPLPSGAYQRSTVVGFKIINESPDELSFWLLTRVAQKSGETSKEQVVYTRSLAGVRWESDDWKLSAQATMTAQQKVQGKPKPAGAAPGDAKFNSSGWTAIREAS
ncbi:hypothetical protein ACH5A3_39780 [Streptomyces echinatus]|uniref:hypothetical protein n=1 Tax=Streptomyces echinatus TaxID=67293 RepID=UPI003794155D